MACSVMLRTPYSGEMLTVSHKKCRILNFIYNTYIHIYIYIHIHTHIVILYIGIPRWCSVKESTCQFKKDRRGWFDDWLGKIPWRREWETTPVLLGNSMDGGAWPAIVHGVAKSGVRD